MITSLWSDWPWKTKQASHKMMHDFSKFVYPRQMWKKKVRCCVWSVERILSFRGDAPNLQEPNTMMSVKEISLESLLTMDRACSGRLRGEKQVERAATREKKGSDCPCSCNGRDGYRVDTNNHWQTSDFSSRLFFFSLHIWSWILESNTRHFF